MSETTTSCPCAACATARSYGYPVLCCPNGFVHGSCCTHGSRFVSAPLTAAPGVADPDAGLPTIEDVRGILAGCEWLPETEEADRKIGAALRAALAEVTRGEQLEIYRAAMGPDRLLVNHSMLYEPDAETDATRALAVLLRSSPPEGPIE